MDTDIRLEEKKSYIRYHLSKDEFFLERYYSSINNLIHLRLCLYLFSFFFFLIIEY